MGGEVGGWGLGIGDWGARAVRERGSGSCEDRKEAGFGVLAVVLE